MMDEKITNPVLRPPVDTGNVEMALSRQILYDTSVEGDATQEQAVRQARRFVVRALTLAYLILGALLIAVGCLCWWAAKVQTAFAILTAAGLGFILMFLFVSLMNALRSRSRTIDGIPLQRDDAEVLFDLIDSIEESAKHELETDSFDELFGDTASIEEVVIAPEFNAAIVQVPRWSILGAYRTRLVLGLPFLQAITLPEFRATLAHELYLLYGDGHTNDSWAWRTREAWERFLNRMKRSKSVGAMVLRGMFGSVAHRIVSVLTPVCRTFVGDADKFAVKIENTEQVASVLARVEVVALQYEKAWEALADCDVSKQAPGGVYGRFEEVMRNSYSESDAQVWLGKTLCQRSAESDPIPALVERLEGIGNAPGPTVIEAAEAGNFEILPAIPEVPVEREAATQLFSPEKIKEISDSFRPEWFDLNDAHWKLQHPAVKQARGPGGDQ